MVEGEVKKTLNIVFRGTEDLALAKSLKVFAAEEGASQSAILKGLVRAHIAARRVA
jgi:hypothetical protein